jgi:acyl-CoA dehydrogenase
MGVLTQDEADFMIAFEKDVLEMVNVDHFPLEGLGPVSVKHNMSEQKTKAEKKPAKKAAAKKTEDVS